MGIGKVGQKYWQMQGRTDCKEDGVDILEKAVEELKASKAQQQRVEEEYNQDCAVVETDDVRVELLDDDDCNEEKEEESPSSIHDIDEDNEVEDVKKVQIEAEDEDEDEDEEEEEDEDHISEDDEIEQHSHSIEEQVHADEVMDDGNEEPKWVHEQRVQESIEIYNRQRRMEKLKKEQGGSGGGGGGSMEELVATFSTTQTTIDWNYEAHRDGEENGEKKVFWTEWMDLKLAELVQSCVYDFTAIADSFTELASSEEFRSLPPVTYGVGKHTPLILENVTAEDCRLRWAELDSKQWCDTDTENNGDTMESLCDTNSAAPAVYKICVQPDVLGKGHGAQPTFAAMSNMATGVSSYLKVPTAFPSVSDDDDDDDEAEEEDDYASSKFERFEALD